MLLAILPRTLPGVAVAMAGMVGIIGLGCMLRVGMTLRVTKSLQCAFCHVLMFTFWWAIIVACMCWVSVGFS